MTSTDRALEPFEEQRLAELKAFVAARAAAPAGRTRRYRRRPALTASAAALTIAASAAVALSSGGPTAKAYAIERTPDGVVEIRIRDVTDADALSRELARLGVPARVFYVPQGQVCHQPGVSLVDGDRRGVYTAPGGDGKRDIAVGMSIDTRGLRPGEFLLFGLKKNTVTDEGTTSSVSQYLVTGEVEPCRFTAAPPSSVREKDGHMTVRVEPSIVVP